MNSDIERLCRVVDPRAWSEKPSFYMPDRQQQVERRKSSEVIVRAILEELRKPSEETLWKGSTAIQDYYDGNWDGVNDATEAVIQRAIDHILRDGE